MHKLPGLSGFINQLHLWKSIECAKNRLQQKKIIFVFETIFAFFELLLRGRYDQLEFRNVEVLNLAYLEAFSFQDNPSRSNTISLCILYFLCLIRNLKTSLVNRHSTG